MHKAMLLVLIFHALVSLSCGDSDLQEDYFAQHPKVLAIKAEPPEVRPGEDVSLRLLVGGEAIDQNMDAPVDWFSGEEQAEMLGTAGYDEALTIGLPQDALDGGQSWVDLPIVARIEIGAKTYYGEKYIRIAEDPLGKNPIINAVDITYLLAEERATDQTFNGDQITITLEVRNIALTAQMAALAAGENESLVFRWYVSTSKNSGGKLYTNVDKDSIRELLGATAEASETKPSVVFSLRGEDADGTVQPGLYDVYLVVRDNAAAPQSAADDRFGTDFFYFTLCVGDADTCQDGE
jgi:hypothetical protein